MFKKEPFAKIIDSINEEERDAMLGALGRGVEKGYPVHIGSGGRFEVTRRQRQGRASCQ